MAHLYKPALLLLLGMSPVLQADSLDAAASELPAHEYTAVYQVLRNEKEVGEVTISLSQENEIWTLHGYTHDMHGLAKMLKIKGSQTSTGKWIAGRFQPDDFKINFSLIGYKTGWDANFDWSSGVVTTTSKNRDTQLSLAGGATDPFSLSLNIRSLLAESQTQMTLDVIDEDIVDSEVYAAEPDTSFDTELGCLQTMRVSRVRENKKRTSLVWYASNYDYVPVKMHHSKKKGNQLELQISSLNFDGQIIKPVDPCSNTTPKA